MYRRLITLQPLLLAFLIAGCGGRSDGLRILGELREDGLLTDDVGGEVRPAPLAHDHDHLTWTSQQQLTTDSILSVADQLNPRIAAARAQVGVAGGRAWQASFYPNPSLDVESENVRPSGGGFGISQTTVGITQPIIISDRRDAAIAAGAARISAERLELEAVRREVHGAIRRELTEVEYLRDALSRHEQLRELAKRTLDVAQSRFGARAAPESEAIRARVEFNGLGLTIERLRGDMAATGERLKALLGGEPVPLERIVFDHENDRDELPPLEHLITLVQNSHPSILAAEAKIETALHQVDLERARQYPDVTARVGVGIDHADDEGFVEAGIGIPLPLFDRNEGSVLAARFEVIQQRQLAAAVADELVGRLSETYRRWESAMRRLVVFEEQILTDAQRAYDQATVGYEAGKLPFLDLLDAQRTLIEAQLSQLELRRAVRHSRSEMAQILGGTQVLDSTSGELQ